MTSNINTDHRLRNALIILIVTFVMAFFLVPKGKSQSPHFGCYSDTTCKSFLSSIDWGTLSPGDSVKRILYIKNLDDARLSGLSFSMVEVVPEGAKNYLRLESSVGSASLRKNDYTEVELTLGVDPQIHDVTDFSFSVIVTASFSEDSGDSLSSPGFGGWAGSDTEFEDSIEIPSKRGAGGLSSGAQVVLAFAFVVCVYLLIKGKV